MRRSSQKSKPTFERPSALHIRDGWRQLTGKRASSLWGSSMAPRPGLRCCGRTGSSGSWTGAARRDPAAGPSRSTSCCRGTLRLEHKQVTVYCTRSLHFLLNILFPQLLKFNNQLAARPTSVTCGWGRRSSEVTEKLCASWRNPKRRLQVYLGQNAKRNVPSFFILSRFVPNLPVLKNPLQNSWIQNWITFKIYCDIRSGPASQSFHASLFSSFCAVLLTNIQKNWRRNKRGN